MGVVVRDGTDFEGRVAVEEISSLKLRDNVCDRDDDGVLVRYVTDASCELEMLVEADWESE